ncbi:unnamed protein product [Rodentolepis nana]|uniref:ACB domain-containing protein n=1 Tax=Rodentolepis nana TaxID=102285 RepID=A0A0R3TQM0_RODNA|nr:unnamed protein product [Rodentolepis nana]
MSGMSFEVAAQKMRELKGVAEADMEELYGLYKQATVGDNNKDRPGILSLMERRKWDAWTKKKGMSQEKAKEEYIKKAESLL